MTPVKIRSLSVAELESDLSVFVDLLKDAVDGGASLGFVAPLPADEAAEYWLSLRGDMLAGSRIVLAARVGSQLIGTGQLQFPRWATATHRAEIQKLLVDGSVRGRGVGRLLMHALHDAARARGCSLIVLSTRHAEPPERFYKALGYRMAGMIPGYTRDANGKRYGTTTLYREFAT